MLVRHRVVEKVLALVIIAVLGLFGIVCMLEISKLTHGFETSTWVVSVGLLAMLLSRMYNYLVS